MMALNTVNQAPLPKPCDEHSAVPDVHEPPEAPEGNESVASSDATGELSFCVWPAWMEAKRSRLAHSNTMMLDAVSPTPGDEGGDGRACSGSGRHCEAAEDCAPAGWLEHAVAGMIVHPHSPLRGAWDLFGALLIGYDFIVTPLQLFDLPQGPGLVAMEWVVLLYWLCDLPYSLLTGHSLPVGTVEMRPRRVARHYLCTWLLFDLLLVALHVSERALSSAGVSGVTRLDMSMPRVLRVLHWLRLLRLLRVVRFYRVPEIARAVTRTLQAEHIGILAGILRILVALLAVAHLLACGWYGIGSRDGATASWLEDMDLGDAGVGLRYAASLHWSVGQFTGEAEITMPRTLRERAFAILALLCGFVVSTYAVAGITSSMTRLQILAAGQSQKMAMLKQFLRAHGISAHVALRVQRNAMFALAQKKKHASEASIELLNLISEPLRIEVHYEIHEQVLTAHPFFRCYNQANTPAMRRICHVAVSEASLCRGDILFHGGEIPSLPSTYFCTYGKLRYSPNSTLHVEADMAPGEWACEAVLWTPWVHTGTLRASSECTFLLLNTQQFQSIARQFQTREFYPLMYAQEFVKCLNATDKEALTDLHMPEIDSDRICASVFADTSFIASKLNLTSSDGPRKGSVLSRSMSAAERGSVWAFKRGESQEIEDVGPDSLHDQRKPRLSRLSSKRNSSRRSSAAWDAWRQPADVLDDEQLRVSGM